MMFFTPGELFPWTVGYETVTAAGIGLNMASHCRWSFQNGSLFGSEKVPDTACHYCAEKNHCPGKIRIPDMFACMNKKIIFTDCNQNYHYSNVLSAGDNRRHPRAFSAMAVKGSARSTCRYTNF